MQLFDPLGERSLGSSRGSIDRDTTGDWILILSI